MAEPNVLAVLRAALPRVIDPVRPPGRVAALRGLPGLGALFAGLPLSVEQGFKPLHDALRAEGLDVVDGVVSKLDGATDGSPPPLVVALPPRSRDEGRALLARAWQEVAVGGVVVGAALNDEGARSYEKDLAALAVLAGTLSKAHGRAFWTVPRPAALAADAKAVLDRWRAADAPRLDPASGRWTRPGVFNEGRLDAGSALLIEHLPDDLRGRIADLGSGSGLLSIAALERCRGITSLDLFEAEARALDLARRNLAGASLPIGFHWLDVARGVARPEGGFDTVLCNPPFHIGARGVPALGRAFIAAAAASLHHGGQLLLVANRHLPYEDVLRESFGRGEALAERAGFKVYRAWAPRRSG
ncbi:MAG TPA: 16S rRNA methyltransferase [Xanthomonadaceae bacterium]|nr:16S rRNA methyltransferase [Xanthomonadaceae bacterium]